MMRVKTAKNQRNEKVIVHQVNYVFAFCNQHIVFLVFLFPLFAPAHRQEEEGVMTPIIKVKRRYGVRVWEGD